MIYFFFKGLFVSVQHSLSSGGSSQSSRLIRSILVNTDAFFLYRTSLRDFRLFIQSFTFGSRYKLYKDLFIRFLEENNYEKPSDLRIHRPFLIFSFNGSSKPQFSIREFTTNVVDNRLFPFCP